MSNTNDFAQNANAVVDALLRLLNELSILIEAKPFAVLGAVLALSVVIFAVAFAALAVLKNTTAKKTTN